MSRRDNQMMARQMRADQASVNLIGDAICAPTPAGVPNACPTGKREHNGDAIYAPTSRRAIRVPIGHSCTKTFSKWPGTDLAQRHHALRRHALNE